jgi:hypothetical protein
LRSDICRFEVDDIDAVGNSQSSWAMLMDVFISCDIGSLSRVRAYVLPSLQKQSFAGAIRVRLVNYASAERLLPAGDEAISSRLVLMDMTSFRKTNALLGFGEAHNFLFQASRPTEPFLILNPDTFLQQQALERLSQAMADDPVAGLIEARQMPHEHPKEFDPTTRTTPWASGACLLVRPDFFASAGGFDPNYYMYCEDVDLSWRCTLSGRTVKHCPEAGCYHYTAAYGIYRSDRYYLEHFYSSRNSLYLARKFFGKRGESRAIGYLTSSSYPIGFKDAVLRSYKTMNLESADRFCAENGPRVRQHSSQIKIMGFNQYHQVRKAA